MSDLILPITKWSGLSTQLTREAVWGDSNGGLIVQGSSSGFEARLQTWSFPKYRYTMKVNVMRNYFESMTSARNYLLQTMIGFYNEHFGGFASFLLDDNKSPDNVVTGQFIATGDGVKTQFQLQRSFGSYTQPVYTPSITSTDPSYIVPKVYDNTTSIGGWTMDPHTGILTLSGPLATGHILTADFAYFWRVRFEDSTFLVQTAEGLPQFWESHEFKLLTSRT